MVDIYVPKKELILPSRVHSKVAGYISWKVCKKDGRVVREAGPYKNLITDVGLDRWGSGTSDSVFTDSASYCAVGTGNTAPAASNTGLENEIGSRSGSSSSLAGGVQVDTLPYYGWGRYSYEFASGDAQGNLTELGFFSSPSTGSIFSRQLFRDGNGDPTSVTVLSDEFLVVTYEVRLYLPNPVDVVQNSVTISGVDYDITTRPQGLGSSNRWSGSIEHAFDPNTLSSNAARLSNDELITVDQFSTAGSTSDNLSRGNYTDGSFTREIEYVWNPGNVTGEYKKVIWNNSKWQTLFSPSFQISADDRLTLQFSVSWGRQ